MLVGLIAKWCIAILIFFTVPSIYAQGVFNPQRNQLESKNTQHLDIFFVSNSPIQWEFHKNLEILIDKFADNPSPKRASFVITGPLETGVVLEPRSDPRNQKISGFKFEPTLGGAGLYLYQKKLQLFANGVEPLIIMPISCGEYFEVDTGKEDYIVFEGVGLKEAQFTKTEISSYAAFKGRGSFKTLYPWMHISEASDFGRLGFSENFAEVIASKDLKTIRVLIAEPEKMMASSILESLLVLRDEAKKRNIKVEVFFVTAADGAGSNILGSIDGIDRIFPEFTVYGAAIKSQDFSPYQSEIGLQIQSKAASNILLRDTIQGMMKQSWSESAEEVSSVELKSEKETYLLTSEKIIEGSVGLIVRRLFYDGAMLWDVEFHSKWQVENLKMNFISEEHILPFKIYYDANLRVWKGVAFSYVEDPAKLGDFRLHVSLDRFEFQTGVLRMPNLDDSRSEQIVTYGRWDRSKVASADIMIDQLYKDIVRYEISQKMNSKESVLRTILGWDDTVKYLEYEQWPDKFKAELTERLAAKIKNFDSVHPEIHLKRLVELSQENERIIQSLRSERLRKLRNIKHIKVP